MALAYERGKKALDKTFYRTAIEEFSSAIKDHPESPIYYTERSSAYSRNGDLEKALQDAEAAVYLAKKRSKGELIAKAQLRRAITLYHLGRFRDAQMCLAWSEEKDNKEKMLAIWQVKTNAKVNAGEGPAMSILQYPTEEVLKLARGDKVVEVKDDNIETGGNETSATDASRLATTSAADTPKPPAPTGVTTAPSQIRHDWYQSSETVSVSLMVKGVPKDKAVVDIEKNSVSISFPLPTGSDYQFSLDPLYSAIDPTNSTYKVMGTKIELVLRKATPGSKWRSLEGTAPVEGDKEEEKPKPIPEAITKAPLYPSSSKSGPKDWDRVAKDEFKKAKEEITKAKQEAAIAAGKNPKDVSSAEVGDDLDDGDAANDFFKYLYRNADPDTKRAMMKSYTESNGTALSTNWNDVKLKKQETVPPDGMIAKKYEY